MNDWARTRKRIILSILLSAITLLVVVPMILLFYRAPTCTDGKLNGDEKGVDCGGSCQRLCTAESLPIVIKGDPRILKIATSTYEVVALFENPNANAEIEHAVYTFKLYKLGESTPIKTLSNQTFVPRGSEFAIFDGPFTLGDEPLVAVLEWQKESLVWQKANDELPDIRVSNPLLSSEKTSPHLEVVVENNTLNRVANIDLTAIISDPEGNTFAASKTFVDTLKTGESATAVFSWPRGFERQAANIQVIPRVFPDPSYLR